MSWGATSPTRPLPPAAGSLPEHTARACDAVGTGPGDGDSTRAGRVVFGGVGR